MTSSPQHVVLAATDSQPYASLRSQPTPRAERYKLGRALRHRVPRSSLGDWEPPPDRRSPVDHVEQSHEGRLAELVPVRVGRMLASPFGFLRGAAAVMAEDFAGLPATGITPVICGDAHIGNFGFYGSPEQDLVLDLNDFDEAHPGSWEWDLRRLTTSVWVAGRQNGFSEQRCEEATASCVASYRDQVRRLAEQPLLARSFERIDVDRLQAEMGDSPLGEAIGRAARRARTKTSDRALPRYTEEHEGRRRIVEEPPLITRLGAEDAEAVGAALDDYLATLAPHWRRVLGGYTLLDTAHKVVGVGSVGLRAYVALCEGSSPDDVLFLQLKQARRSVVAPYVHGDSAWHAHQGQRVVEYQQALQTVSDPLLGWTTIGKLQYYVRQFRNMKGAIALDGIDAPALTDYAGICGRLLAKGHARTSGASMIAGYVGKGDNVDVSLCRFARAYADQTERDHQALAEAVDQGRLPVERGI
ncbi:MAG TPA: DUF2252 domain-containing protein [Actinomycetales bacterium]|nr:DUF2252 domain-containing protein [Actinomycetales bacterium]